MLNSPIDLALVGTVILLVFGPKKLPELGKALGQGIGNFKKSLEEAQNPLAADDKNKPPSSPAVVDETKTQEPAAPAS